MVLCEHMPYAGSQVWDSNFLPPIHQGVRIVPGPEPIPDLRPPQEQSLSLEELERMMLRDVNERHIRHARRATPTFAPGSRPSTWHGA